MSYNLDRLRYLEKLKEEKKILVREMNLYYFERNKRRLIFSRLERVEKEIERVEKDENCDLWKPKKR